MMGPWGSQGGPQRGQSMEGVGGSGCRCAEGRVVSDGWVIEGGSDGHVSRPCMTLDGLRSIGLRLRARQIEWQGAWCSGPRSKGFGLRARILVFVSLWPGASP